MPKSSSKKKNKNTKHRAVATAEEETDGAISIPITWIYAIVGLFLLPICYVTLRTFIISFHRVTSEAGFLGSAPIWFFGIGFLVWMMAFYMLPRPTRIYVFGHEFTHALFAVLSGGRIEEFSVTRDGGHVVTDRNNIWIALSPYFVPIYSVFALLIYGVAGIFTDVSAYHKGAWFWGSAGFSWSWVLYAAVGLTWAFHLTFTAWMIGKNQPDLQLNGTFFSLVFIVLINVLVLAVLLVIAEPRLGLGDFCSEWLRQFGEMMLRFQRG
ncbi:MAG: hypothetical protein AAGA58_04170 [Verrucomicrobiota bacterium]